jgi:hypothetical protein
MEGAVRGPILWPGDLRANEELAGFNTATVHRPAAVVAATDAADVVAAVRYASRAGLAVEVHGTGHGSTSSAGTGALLGLFTAGIFWAVGLTRRTWVGRSRPISNAVSAAARRSSSTRPRGSASRGAGWWRPLRIRLARSSTCGTRGFACSSRRPTDACCFPRIGDAVKTRSSSSPTATTSEWTLCPSARTPHRRPDGHWQAAAANFAAGLYDAERLGGHRRGRRLTGAPRPALDRPRRTARQGQAGAANLRLVVSIAKRYTGITISEFRGMVHRYPTRTHVSRVPPAPPALEMQHRIHLVCEFANWVELSTAA